MVLFYFSCGPFQDAAHGFEFDAHQLFGNRVVRIECFTLRRTSAVMGLKLCCVGRLCCAIFFCFLFLRGFGVASA